MAMAEALVAAIAIATDRATVAVRSQHQQWRIIDSNCNNLAREMPMAVATAAVAAAVVVIGKIHEDVILSYEV